MTLSLAATIPEGIVICSDSRASVQDTINVQGKDALLRRAVSDFEAKVFVANGLAINTWGVGHMQGADVERHIQKFLASTQRPTTPREFALELADYFEPIMQAENIQQVLGFFVAGWEVDSGSVWLINVSATGKKVVPSITTTHPNITMSGQAGVASRLLLGYDATTVTLPTGQGSDVQLADAIRKTESILPLHSQNIQDAIDLCEFLIRTTEFWQDHTFGTVGNPDSLSGVGGPIDVAVVTPSGASWVRKKEPR